ncbi:GNAT family N-acetyltransferase [Sinomonas albida]|uniref:GNAT family N-acetyltransferase n=1 Tax=Sinomonas albida TaxID=369942 RepID=UPI003019C2F4
MSIVWKPIVPAHAPAWAELSNLLAFDQGVEDYYAPHDLASELEEPWVDSSLDTLAAWDGGTMVAYGQLRVAHRLQDGLANAFLGGGVHPRWRGRGLGGAVMDWIEPRAAELSRKRHPGAPGILSFWAGAPGSSSAHLATTRGYLPARYLHDFALDLTSWSPSTSPGAAPQDVATRTLDLGDRAIVEATRRAHNEAFAGQPGAAEHDPDSWAGQLLAGPFRPELSRVAVGSGEGLPREESVESYVLSRDGAPGELYVSLVGTRVRARRRGLARRLLREVLVAAKAAGCRSVALGVDAARPSGAVGLYTQAGFRLLRTDVVYEKFFLGLAERPSVAVLPGQPAQAGRRARALAVSA